MAAIVTVTLNPSVDRSASVKYITPDDKLPCTDGRIDPGGGGLNICRGLKTLGGSGEAIYTSGGPVGQMLSSLLDQLDIPHRPQLIQEWTRENFVILEEVSGKEYRFNLPGPTLKPAEWQSILDLVRSMQPSPSFIVGSGSLAAGVPTDFFRQLGLIAAERGSHYILDTSGEALVEALKSPLYLIKPNLRELRNLSGKPLEHAEEQEAAAASLVADGSCKFVVLSLGAAGALLVGKDLKQHFRSPTVPLRSTVGAGDSMVAGILLRLQQGTSITEAVAYGVACGAAAVATPGTGFGSKDFVERLYEQVRQGL